MKNIKPFIRLSITILLFLTPCLLFAQPGFEDDVNDVPLDGGISLLLAAGVGYGAKKIHAKKNKK